MNWQDRLRDNVTSTAFHMTLSTNMINVLDAIKNSDIGYYRGFNRWVPTARSLEDRGLIIYHDPDSLGDTVVRNSLGYMSPPMHKIWEITPAGECVYTLLCHAGILKASLRRAS